MTAIEAMPLVDVVFDGRSLGDQLLAQVIQLDVLQRVNEPASCEVEIVDADGDAASRIATGAKLAVFLGIERHCVFDGEVAAVELNLRGQRDRLLRVLAYDALDRLRRGAPLRVHSDVTLSDLARELTEPLGLRVEIERPRAIEPRVVQHRRSDLDLLVALAEREGVYLVLERDCLRAYPIEPAGSAKTLEVGIGARELTVRLSEVDTAAAVSVRGWDPHLVREVRGHATRPARSSADVTLTNVIARSDAQADTLAASQAARRASSGAVLSAVVEGDPSFGAGTSVRLDGVPGAFTGPFRVTSARHRLSPSLGYVVELSSALPRPHPPVQAATATLGVVADVRDPRRFGRVKVRYPALGDAESDWLQVLAAGAGGKKGLLALPAVDDHVLVIGFDDDPAHGVVLGALYGDTGLPDQRSDAFHGYALYSPGGHAIELDDEGALRIRATDGTLVELGRDAARLHSETDLRIDAPGKTITIAAAHVEIEQA